MSRVQNKDDRRQGMNNKYSDMADNQLIAYAIEYASHWTGELSELVYALAVRVGVLAGRVKILEKEIDDCK